MLVRQAASRSMKKPMHALPVALFSSQSRHFVEFPVDRNKMSKASVSELKHNKQYAMGVAITPFLHRYNLFNLQDLGHHVAFALAMDDGSVLILGEEKHAFPKIGTGVYNELHYMSSNDKHFTAISTSSELHINGEHLKDVIQKVDKEVCGKQVYTLIGRNCGTTVAQGLIYLMDRIDKQKDECPKMKAEQIEQLHKLLQTVLGLNNGYGTRNNFAIMKEVNRIELEVLPKYKTVQESGLKPAGK